MTADPCAMPIGRGQTCSHPGDHDGGCEWPRRVDPIAAAIRRHPAGKRLRCRCSHGPSTHTGGYGQCWQHPCGCDRYEDHTPPRAPEHLRIDDIQDYLRQKGEIS